MSFVTRIQTTLSYLISAALMVSLAFSVWNGYWFNAAIAVMAFSLTYVPSIIQRNYRIHIPTEFEFLFVVFIFSSLYLGEVREYYVHFWWWDIFLHTFSGVLLGMVGYVLVYVLNDQDRVPIRLTPFFIAFFSFSFAVCLGAIWEVFEFGMDSVFGFNMQKSGNVDTMTDMIVNLLGALLVAVLGYFYSKKVKFDLVDRLIGKFVENNPRLFKRWTDS